MPRYSAIAGPTNSLLDVGHVRIGHSHNSEIKTGVTAIIPTRPVVMGVDVRGGGPGTRETEALNPHCLVERVHGLVFSGGSVFGLAAADQIVQRLSADKIGLELAGMHVPVVPSAILYDLSNGGDKNWNDSPSYNPPYRDLADQAYDALSIEPFPADRAGLIGAGYGATAGGQRGGLATASFILPDGMCVAAMVAVNSFGEIIPNREAIAGSSSGLSSANAPEIAPLGVVESKKMPLMGGNTTLAVVASNVALNKADCQRMAIMAHDGLARSIRPLHTPFDGDSVFAFSTEAMAMPQDAKPQTLSLLGSLAADALQKAVQSLYTPSK